MNHAKVLSRFHALPHALRWSMLPLARAITVIVLGLWLSACEPSPPTMSPPTPQILQTPSPTQISAMTLTSTSQTIPTPIEKVESTFTPLPDTPTPTPPPTPTALPPVPTATPCGPPANWAIYVVRSGDTLFRLAINTQTTVAQIKLANCLVSDVIYSGQKLYLPYIPVVPTSTALPELTPTPVPTSTKPACDNDFCPNPDLEGSLTIEPGGPNNPEFVPCEAVTEPRVEFDTTTKIVELGQRRYFYVCINSPVSASITREDGQVMQVTLRNTIPNPDLQIGNARAVVDWPVLPFEPTGIHTMTVTRSDGPPVDFRFLVAIPNEERILTVPQAGEPGTIFQVYYVNFDMNATETFEFYGEDEPAVGRNHHFSQRSSWQVVINQPLVGLGGKGWAQVPLASEIYNSLGAYSITFDNRRIYDLFWLR